MRVVSADAVEKAFAALAPNGVDGIPKAVVVEPVLRQRILRCPGAARVAHLEKTDVGVGDDVRRQNVVVAPVRMVDEEDMRRIPLLRRKMPYLIPRLAYDRSDGRIGQLFH